MQLAIAKHIWPTIRSTVRTFQPIGFFVILATLAVSPGCKKEEVKPAPRKIALGFTTAGTVKSMNVHAGQRLNRFHNLTMSLVPAWVTAQAAVDEADRVEARLVGNVAHSESMLESAKWRNADLATATAAHDQAVKELQDLRDRKAAALKEKAGHALPSAPIAKDIEHIMLDGDTLEWPPPKWEYRDYSGHVESVIVKEGDVLAANAVTVIVTEGDEEPKEH